MIEAYHATRLLVHLAVSLAVLSGCARTDTTEQKSSTVTYESGSKTDSKDLPPPVEKRSPASKDPMAGGIACFDNAEYAKAVL